MLHNELKRIVDSNSLNRAKTKGTVLLTGNIHFILPTVISPLTFDALQCQSYFSKFINHLKFCNEFGWHLVFLLFDHFYVYIG